MSVPEDRHHAVSPFDAPHLARSVRLCEDSAVPACLGPGSLRPEAGERQLAPGELVADCPVAGPVRVRRPTVGLGGLEYVAPAVMGGWRHPRTLSPCGRPRSACRPGA